MPMENIGPIMGYEVALLKNQMTQNQLEGQWNHNDMKFYFKVKEAKRLNKWYILWI